MKNKIEIEIENVTSKHNIFYIMPKEHVFHSCNIVTIVVKCSCG